MNNDPGPSTRWIVLTVLGFTVALVAVFLVASGGDDGGSAPDTQETLTAVEVFLQGEGIDNYDLADLDLAVEAMIDSCANDDTLGFRLTYALTLQGNGSDDDLARAVVEAICPERLAELDPAS